MVPLELRMVVMDEESDNKRGLLGNNINNGYDGVLYIDDVLNVEFQDTFFYRRQIPLLEARQSLVASLPELSFPIDVSRDEYNSFDVPPISCFPCSCRN